MSVNAVRKQSSDEEVQNIAKSLIKSWKKLLGEEHGWWSRGHCVLVSVEMIGFVLSCRRFRGEEEGGRLPGEAFVHLQGLRQQREKVCLTLMMSYACKWSKVLKLKASSGVLQHQALRGVPRRSHQPRPSPTSRLLPPCSCHH